MVESISLPAEDQWDLILPVFVQVKSSSSPVNVEVIHRLHGSMKLVGADQGLFISWGGFNSKFPPKKEPSSSRFDFGTLEISSKLCWRTTISCRQTFKPIFP